MPNPAPQSSTTRRYKVSCTGRVGELPVEHVFWFYDLPEAKTQARHFYEIDQLVDGEFLNGTHVNIYDELTDTRGKVFPSGRIRWNRSR